MKPSISKASNFILHMSDFHLTNNKKDIKCATAALDALADKLRSEHIKVDYLLHTGDIINSGDLYNQIALELECCKDFFDADEKSVHQDVVKKFDASRFEKEASEEDKEEFNQKLRVLTARRFEEAVDVIKHFVSRLNISLGNVVICCGNHDVLRPFFRSDTPAHCKQSGGESYYSCNREVEDTFRPFEEFLDQLETANSRKRQNRDKSADKQNAPVTHFTLGNLNILIINTNWENPKNVKLGYYCVRCDQIQAAIQSMNLPDTNRQNIILAHKPIYEICEAARLSYKRYIKTRFMASLQEFVGENGIYLCGDKHTRSIVGSSFHDIPHYIGGEPLTTANPVTHDFEVEYNLLEVIGCQLGLERKIHLRSSNGDTWKCDLRPQDAVVSRLYDLSKDFFISNVLETLAMPKITPTWENVCQEVYGWKSAVRKQWFKNLDELYKTICKFRKNGSTDLLLETSEKNIFVFMRDRIKERIEECREEKNSNNLLNIRGEYSSGKSTFLGLLYIYLLHEYSIGSVSFIPVYFNLENNKIFNKIQSGITYCDAAEQTFTDFANEVQKIADKEHQSVCYIIDGLDEQDCWSYSSEDSIGRGVLDILSHYENVYYLMAFSQHRLPRFKNTMPPRTFNDKSDIIYFNPIDVREDGSEDQRFTTFVNAFLLAKDFSKKPRSHEKSGYITSETKKAEGQQRPQEKDTLQESIKLECDIIRRFRRLTINPGFMHHNYEYITAIDEKTSELLHQFSTIDDIYRYYIDQQYELCLQKLGYGFIHYAPAMAFLFSYHGYTYEQFKRLPENHVLKDMPMIKLICENHDKIYNSFVFIKKQNDAREYLIALHYNRELRYYAEHPNKKIAEDSILNEYITRNIAVLIRKLWSDTNKFIIVCEKLLQRDKLSNCLQSMLIYCLVHQEMYAPILHQLQEKMFERGRNTLLMQQENRIDTQGDEWLVHGKDDAERLQHFLDLSLKHTMQVCDATHTNDLVSLFIENEPFRVYNRQHQMLYYGDLSIRGEDKRHSLNPGIDTVYKGFDFHNCFNYLYVKLSSGNQYPLKKFDMCTIWDLVYSRLLECGQQEHMEDNRNLSTFFYRDVFKEKSDKIISQLLYIFDDYIEKNVIPLAQERVYFRVVRCYLRRILQIRKTENFASQAKHINALLQPLGNVSFWDSLLKKDYDDEQLCKYLADCDPKYFANCQKSCVTSQKNTKFSQSPCDKACATKASNNKRRRRKK
ncbi:MAG: metallophosphoesterase [Clostridiales bacterium]|nr:metallophosphoesterase [Clostridiales bacterium]